MSNPNAATRYDPFGEYGHILPVPVIDAATELRSALLNYETVGKEVANLRSKLQIAEKNLQEAQARREEAQHRMTISALDLKV